MLPAILLLTGAVLPAFPGTPLTSLQVAAGPAAQASGPLAHEHYELANGLDVILHVDRSSPQAVVNLWYDVGAKDEPAGRSGFAHMFEHLMFMGTERVGIGQFDTLMETGGGWNNASTGTDRTNYFDVAPSELLPTLLWLEADRLEGLADAMTQEKLDSQREVVLNEYRQNYENSPYGFVYPKTLELIYPSEHPYRHSPIGTPEELNAATVEDVVDFFHEFYVPNNASLVVAGDFDPAAVKPLIERLFGDLPRGDEPSRRDTPSLLIDSERRATLTDAVRLPMVSMAWPSPAFYAPGDAELDLASAILSAPPSGRLYKALVDTGLSVGVSAAQYSSGLASVYFVQAVAAPGANLAEIERVIGAELGRFAEEGPTERELADHQRSFELQMAQGLESLQDRADLLNRYRHHFGRPDAFDEDLARYSGATVDGIREAAQIFLQPGRAVVTALPRMEGGTAGDPRAERPANFASRAPEVAAPQVARLSNGIQVRHWERPELPIFSASVLLPGGALEDDLAENGLTTLAASMLDQGATLASGETLDASEFAGALGRLGAQLGVQALDDAVVVSLESVSASASDAFDLLGAALVRPAFGEADWDRVQGLMLEGLRSESDDPGAVAARVERRLWYGEGHPLSLPPGGSVATLEPLTRERAMERAAGFASGGATVFCAGDLTLAEVVEHLERNFSSVAIAPRSMLEPPAPVLAGANGLLVALVDRPGATQTQVRFSLPVADALLADRTALDLVSVVLGGTFTSRLNSNLREDKGWTYGARARLSESRFGLSLGASASIQVDATGPAVAEFMAEFGALGRGDVTASEAEKARSSRRQRIVERMAGSGGLVSQAVRLERLGREFETLAADLVEMGQLEAAQLNSVAAAALRPSLLVLVGDAAALRPQLEAARSAGLDLPREVLIDAQGSLLGD